MRKKHWIIELGIVSFVIFLMLWIFIPKFIGSQDIDFYQSFPDPGMRQAVVEALRLHENIQLTVNHANEFKGELRIQNCDDLSGLHYFPNIKSISVYSDSLTEIDLSPLQKLETLYYSGLQLRRLNTSGNPNLKYVTLSNRSTETPADIPVLDFSNNPKIQKLTIRNYYLEHLDVSALPELNYLDCVNSYQYNLRTWKGLERGLTSLDVSHNPQLKTLHLTFNKLKELDLSNNPNLWTLVCTFNELTALNLTKNTRLRVLHCDMNQLQKLDISACAGLDTVSCSYNQLRELDTANHQYIQYLRCYQNQLITIDVSASQKLASLVAINNPLEILKLPSISAIKKIQVDKGNLNAESLVVYEQYEPLTESPANVPAELLLEDVHR